MGWGVPPTPPPDPTISAADVLWATRWDRLYYPDPDTEGRLRWYERAEDMNHDGAVTISDVGLWAQWLWSLPGDYVLIGLGRVVI